MVVLVKIPQVPVPAGSGQLPLSFFSSWRRVLVYFHFTSKEEKENYYAHTLKVILATMVALPPTWPDQARSTQRTLSEKVDTSVLVVSAT